MIEAECVDGIGVVHRVDPLRFREMIAAADRAERCRERVIREPGGRDERLPACIGRGIDRAEPARELRRADAPRIERGLPQRHSAADIAADQRRVQPARRKERGADRVAASGVKIGHAGDTPHAGEGGSVFELPDGLTFDPGGGASAQGDALAQVLHGIAHGGFRSMKR
ncbi:hypothetical protein BC2230_20705 [Burkholderia cepacia]